MEKSLWSKSCKTWPLKSIFLYYICAMKELNYSFSPPLSFFGFFFFAEQQQFWKYYILKDYIQGGGGNDTYKMLF